MTIQEQLHQALANQRVGKLSEAAETYKEILRVDAAHPDALHLLGLIESKQGNHADAIHLIEQAAAAAPASTVILGNLGVVLRRAGRTSAAIDAYRRALALDPENADIYFNLGKSLKAAGDFGEAETAFRKAISLAPEKPSAWLSLASLYADRETSAAVQIAEQAVHYCPDNVDVHMNVGALYRKAGRSEDALRAYRRAVELAPRKVDALCRLASSLISGRDVEEGQKYLALAQSIEPESIHVLNALGLLHNTLGNATAAINVFRRAIELYPEYGTAHSNLSSALRKLGEVSDSLAAVQRGIELEPKNIESKVIEGGALMLLGRLKEAERAFRSAIDMKDGYRDAHDSLLMCQHYQPEQTAHSILQSHLEWNRLYAEHLGGGLAFPDGGQNDRKIHIGFVSADLGAHPVGYFTVRLFESLDRDRFSTTVYSDRLGNDVMSERIKRSVDRWYDTAPLTDDQLTETIREHQVDILFDMAGHTAQNRMLVFARRAARVQISWAGYVGTTGLSTMDYLLADNYHTPLGVEANFTEKLLRMPNGYVTYCAPEGLPEVGPLPALRNGYVTFGAMCNPAKVNPDVLRLWSQILQRAPESRLMLSYCGWPDPANRQRVLHGLGPSICPSRVRFEYKTGPAGLMALYGDVDVALDTFPYSGGLTTIEALWMGVPTITLPGDRFEGRHSLSHLTNVGLNDCIAASETEYIDKALRLAADVPGLSQLRAGLRDKMLASPLCNGPLFAEHFGLLMQQVWVASRTLDRDMRTTASAR